MTFDLVTWLRSSALPLWGDVGLDAASGLFVERLDLDGRPLIEGPRRVMVQARQIFVFAEAHARGWYPGAALAERAGDAMVRTFRREDAGWIFSASADGRPVDETRDLYAHAFVLLALATLKRVTGSDRWLRLADATLDVLDAHLATPATGGYAESIPARPGPRRQNPHMHLFEALLALDAASPGGPYRRRAEAMIDLLRSRFLHGPHPVVVEFYDDKLRPIIGPPFAFEPGHHFEWAWLLARAALSGHSTPPGLAARLCEVAHRLGATGDGVFVDAVDGDGKVLSASTRLWPSTEAIKATAIGQGRGSGRPACIVVEAMHRRFLAPAATGCWIDQVSVDGRPLSAFVAASSLYHLVGAATALADPCA